MKIYITFGQDHAHHVYGKTFDHNCVAVIEAESYKNGRAKAFELFGDKWCFSYMNKEAVKIEYYPRGFINIARDD